MDYNSAEYYIEHLDIIDSTNSYTRENAAHLWAAACGAKAIVVYAREQTAGRGQRGNVWQSQAGENLLASIVVRPVSLPVHLQFALSQAIALAVRAAMGYMNVDTQLKWPNDIYAGKRKLAGILVELDCCSELVEQAVIGVGLNVNQEQFAPMDKVPVSMKMLTGETYDVDDVLGVLLDSFSYYYSLLESGNYSLLAADYKAHLLGYKKVMRYCDAVTCFDARIVDVHSNGHLCLQCTDGSTRTYAFKDVELVI